MARPLRIDVDNGWYHVMSRGTERRILFIDKTYCFHFLDLLGEMSKRYAVEVHAYVLMGNHYHLILRTPCANCSQAMQWLNVSFSAWFNAKRGRVGHVFQGRFRSTLVDGDGSWLLDMSAYVHLNPVRVSSLGLGKGQNQAEALGLATPDKEQIILRLKTLREHRWSSYRSYGNYGKRPDWLFTNELLRRAGGARAYRNFVQSYVTRGMAPDEFETLSDRVAIGSERFRNWARSVVPHTSAEQPDRAFVARRIPMARIMQVVEEAKGESWSDFHGRYGDWGTAMLLSLARTYSGLTLGEIGEAAGGMAYKAVAASVSRFKQRLAKDPAIRRVYEDCVARMQNVET